MKVKIFSKLYEHLLLFLKWNRDFSLSIQALNAEGELFWDHLFLLSFTLVKNPAYCAPAS